MKKKTTQPTPKAATVSAVPIKTARGGVTDLPTVNDPKAEACYLTDRRGGVRTDLDMGTQRLWESCHYPSNLSFNDLYNMYARNNVAARVIETFPNYTWNIKPVVKDVKGEASRFSKAVSKLLSTPFKWRDGIKQDMLTTMKQLDVLGGIGGEGLMVLGFADGNKLHQPVGGKKGTKLEWLKVLHNGQFRVKTRNEKKESPEYGDVISYESVSFASSDELNFTSTIAPRVEIHSSRCVHFKESAGLGYGTSRIQKCYNQLLDIVKVSGASAEVYWLGAFSGLSIETHPDAVLADGAYEKMKAETEKYFGGLGRSLIFQGASAKLLYPAIVSPQAHFDLQISMVSIATEIPRRFLTGAEAAKLASQQDSINWMDRVTNRRNRFVGPNVVSPVVQRCVDAGVLPAPSGDMIKVVWSQTQSLALNDRADAAKGTTEALAQYFSSGMSKVMEFKEYLISVCGFGEEEAIGLAEKTDVKKYKLPSTTTSTATATSTATKTASTTKKDDAADTTKSLLDKIIAENAETKDALQYALARITELENKPTVNQSRRS